MLRIQKYFILIACLLVITETFAQEQLDTSDSKDAIQLKNLIWIKDTFYGMLKTHDFRTLRLLYPSFKTYRGYIDSSQAGKQSTITQYAMYNNFWNRLYIQYTKALRKSDKAGLDLDYTKLDSFHIDTGYSGGLPFAYVEIIVKYKNKKRFNYSALFLKMEDKWFIIGELKFKGLIPEKKKKVSKKK